MMITAIVVGISNLWVFSICTADKSKMVVIDEANLEDTAEEQDPTEGIKASAQRIRKV